MHTTPVIINMSNVSKGGALQVALSIIESHLANPIATPIHFALSSAILNRINSENLNVPDHIFTKIDANGLGGKIAAKKHLDALIQEQNPNVVCSLFGPTFWRPKHNISHVVGFANLWVITKDKRIYKRLPLIEQLKRKLKYSLMANDFKRNADILLVEAHHVKAKLKQHSKLSNKTVKVAPNGARQLFYEPSRQVPSEILTKLKHDRPELILGAYVAANYVHKNFFLIGQISAAKSAALKNIHFVITIPAEDYSELCQEWPNLKEITTNLGPINSNEVKALYEMSNFGFMPSVLECNTAALHEYIAMGLPIVSADLDYAREICEDTAFYFDPYNVTSTIEALKKYMVEPKIYENKARSLRIKGQGLSSQRWEVMRSILLDVSSAN